jgi:hypothetical protein
MEQSILIITSILVQTILLRRYLTINLKIDLFLFDTQHWLNQVKEHAFVNLQLLFLLNIYLLIEYNSNIFSIIMYKRVTVVKRNIWLKNVWIWCHLTCSNGNRFLFYEIKFLLKLHVFNLSFERIYRISVFLRKTVSKRWRFNAFTENESFQEKTHLFKKKRSK